MCLVLVFFIVSQPLPAGLEFSKTLVSAVVNGIEFPLSPTMWMPEPTGMLCFQGLPYCSFLSLFLMNLRHCDHQIALLSCSLGLVCCHEAERQHQT